MATEEQLRERREQEAKDRREARRLAAANAGHPEWARLPETFREAKALYKPFVFTGKPCQWGHVARIHVWNRRCEECSRPKGKMELEQRYWENWFHQLAEKIEASGRLHYLKKERASYRLIETSRAVPSFDNLRDACTKAARFTAHDGVLRCVVPGATRWVVKKAVS